MLSELQCRNARPKDRPYRLGDRDGLYLIVYPNTRRTWIVRRRVDGRDTAETLGYYPQLSLAKARQAAQALRGLLPKPSQAPVDAAPELSFAQATQEWHDRQLGVWRQRHAEDVLRSLERDVFPAIGSVMIGQITPNMMLNVLRKIEARGASHQVPKVKQRCSAVFQYAAAHGWRDDDPTASLDHALAPRAPAGKRPAVLTLDEARQVIATIDNATGQPATKLALRFTALTAARPGEVVGLRWEELQLDIPEPVWVLPCGRTKLPTEFVGTASDFVIPLSRQAVECLRAVQRAPGQFVRPDALVFQSSWGTRRPLSENTMGKMLNTHGWQGRHCPHGWRATFSSVMNERFPADRYVIDLCLGHGPRDRVEAAYNRAKHMPRRRALVQTWADLLLAGAASADDLLRGARRANPTTDGAPQPKPPPAPPRPEPPPASGEWTLVDWLGLR